MERQEIHVMNLFWKWQMDSWKLIFNLCQCCDYFYLEPDTHTKKISVWGKHTLVIPNKISLRKMGIP